MLFHYVTKHLAQSNVSSRTQNHRPEMLRYNLSNAEIRWPWPYCSTYTCLFGSICREWRLSRLESDPMFPVNVRRHTGSWWRSVGLGSLPSGLALAWSWALSKIWTSSISEQLDATSSCAIRIWPALVVVHNYGRGQIKIFDLNNVTSMRAMIS